MNAEIQRKLARFGDAKINEMCDDIGVWETIAQLYDFGFTAEELEEMEFDHADVERVLG